MPLVLPTDTQHLRPTTRQFELFNRPLGSGVERRKLYVGLGAVVPWIALLALLGVSPFWQFGPALYLVPPGALVVLGTRVGDDGRMVLLVAYDALLAKKPRRRRVITNPLVTTSPPRTGVVSLQVTTRIATGDEQRGIQDCSPTRGTS